MDSSNCSQNGFKLPTSVTLIFFAQKSKQITNTQMQITLHWRQSVKVKIWCLLRSVGRVGEGFQGCSLPRRVREGDALAQNGPARGQNSGKRKNQTQRKAEVRIFAVVGLPTLSPEFEKISQRAAGVTVFSSSVSASLSTPQLGLTMKTPPLASLALGREVMQSCTFHISNTYVPQFFFKK